MRIHFLIEDKLFECIIHSCLLLYVCKNVVLNIFSPLEYIPYLLLMAFHVQTKSIFPRIDTQYLHIRTHVSFSVFFFSCIKHGIEAFYHCLEAIQDYYNIPTSQMYMVIFTVDYCISFILRVFGTYNFTQQFPFIPLES